MSNRHKGRLNYSPRNEKVGAHRPTKEKVGRTRATFGSGHWKLSLLMVRNGEMVVAVVVVVAAK
jgi:hypothetical protein